jgi:hypothetical protein
MPDASTPARSTTLSVTIDRPVDEVHAFLADAMNWPRWAVINVLTVEPGSQPGWWKTTSARDSGEIRIYADAATGILDHDYLDETGTVWRVPARVTTNGRGADFMMTFIQPTGLDDESWDRELALAGTELATLKKVLEDTPLA